jgi:itaconate CoA-transferase
MATLPLTNLLVVSLEQAVAAPYCSSRLADAGARVIKIERAEGDFARGYDKAAKGLSSYFVWLNRGKQSLVADIKDPNDAALLHRILARADVFIQNLAPGAAARSGFGSTQLRNKYPRLITVDISGYGETGDYAAMKAYDLVGPGGIRSRHDHRPSGGSRPGGGFGMRHRLRHGRLLRRPRGIDRPRHHRPRRRTEGQPV